MTLSLINMRRMMIWGLVPMTLLLVPLLAMQVTSEVNWTLGDFLAGGVLLALAGCGCFLARHITQKPSARALATTAVLGAVALIWIDGAVGLF